jgi:hypothetical protein
MARILYFDEDLHRYTDDLKSVYLSTTTLLGMYKDKFDTKGEAKRLARLGTGIYKGKSAKVIEELWATNTGQACRKGSTIHNELENGVKETSMFKDAVHKFRCYDANDKNRLFTIDDVIGYDNLRPLDVNKFYESVGFKYPDIQRTIEFYVEAGFSLYAEIGVYDESRLISGMIDLWAVKGDTFVIIDWKTNKDDIKFDSGYYKRDNLGQTTNEYVAAKRYLNYPLDNLLACKGYEYAMQLSVYARMVEQRGLTCGGLIIFHIRDAYVLNRYGHPYKDKNNNYIVDQLKPRTANHILMPYLKNEVDALFAHHVKTRMKDGIQYKMF